MYDVPINEYIRDRQTILDKTGGTGVFLNSHDRGMKSLVYKTTVCVPEIERCNKREPESCMVEKLTV